MKAAGIYCNRTLNLNSIKAIGYDMDYTLVHYNVEKWERETYDQMKSLLSERFGWDIKHLEFDPESIIRGLIIDKIHGNIVKANRFGFVKKARHGMREMSFDEQKKLYARNIVDLHESRWEFLNTVFSLSEGCLFAQLVDLYDQDKLSEVVGYEDLFNHVREVCNQTHLEGSIKKIIMQKPEEYIEKDPNLGLALLDQKKSGKKLLLITNSDWSYTQRVMDFILKPQDLEGSNWREFFDVLIVSARKPDFFSNTNGLFQVMPESGFLKPSSPAEIAPGKVFYGGSANAVEKHLGFSGDEILYVGDHMFGDVHVSKKALRWRTGLILSELTGEIDSQTAHHKQEVRLHRLMNEKEELEHKLRLGRLELQRNKLGYGIKKPYSAEDLEKLQKDMEQIRQKLVELDKDISPIARETASLHNKYWGLLMRTGNDKSLLAYQIERYADIYMTQVSHLGLATPFAFFRSIRGQLPHDVAER